VSACCCYLERLGALALLVNMDGLSRLNSEAWAVYTLAVDQNVTVNYHLTSLRNGTGEAGTKN
jgi:hypothetical protein